MAVPSQGFTQSLQFQDTSGTTIDFYTLTGIVYIYPDVSK